MRALRLVAAGTPLLEVELPDPEPGPGEVVVRVAAAGICRSDTHYRAGVPKLPPLPRVLGHEIAGTIASVGAGVALAAGDRVALHYQVACADCDACVVGDDRFCSSGEMLGNHRDGGYAEYVLVPERNAVVLPDGIDPAHAAVMMCSSVTALHALRKARLGPGERVAVFGAGGLGMSAIQLARALGASAVYAVDIDAGRLELAAGFGALPIDASREDPVVALQSAGGMDVAVELVGFAATTLQAVRSLRPQGRAAIAGLTGEDTEINVYDDLMSREGELIGVMDHTLSEVEEVLDLARGGSLQLDRIVPGRAPLDADAVNVALDELAAFGAGVRTVIIP
jgi:propanol-preferring alcohol dehydrogenase